MPAPLVCATAQLTCPFGAAPSVLVVVPKGPPVTGEKKPVATIMDHVPMVNIMPFGLCNSPSNPGVAAAKAPVPCTPATAAPWVPGSPTVKVGGFPALNATSTLVCSLAAGGPITVVNPGTTLITVA